MKRMHHIRMAIHLAVALAFPATFAGSYEEFFQAITADDAPAVRHLLQRGFDVDSRDPDGQTALLLALRDGSFKVAEALLDDPEIDLDALNTSHESALMIAALKGHTDWVRLLIDRGARVNQPGWSALHYAATGPQPAVVSLLLDRGADIAAESPNRTTPLMMAARYGNEASVDLLLSRGADAAARNDRGLSAADFARDAGREALARRLEARLR